MNYEEKLEKLIEKHGEENTLLKIYETINSLSGLIDKEGAVEIIFAEQFPDLKKEELTNNEDIQFIDQYKGLLIDIVNKPSVKSALYENAERTNTNYLKTFKFGDIPKNPLPHYTYSGENFECYLFVMSIRTVLTKEMEQLPVITAVLFTKDAKPLVVSIFPPSFAKELYSKNSYNCLFKVKYNGLKESNKNKGFKYHAGTCYRVMKINKLVQSKLV